MRSAFKRAVEGLLMRGGVSSLVGRMNRRRHVILAYHNVVPDGSRPLGDRSLHVPPSRFAEQLDLLRDTHDVVPLPRLLDEPQPRSRPLAAITFDDAYSGAVTAGVAELVKRGLPATIFVAPAMLGGRAFWWDALAAPGGFGLPERLRRLALEELGGRDEAIRARTAQLGKHERALADFARSASETELEAAAREPGIALGSHSWSHPNLTRLEPAELKLELERPRRWLLERYPSAVNWLAFPYGLSSPEVERAAATAGYDAALGITGGLAPARPRNRFRIPRLDVPSDVSVDGFRLRIAGVIS